MPSSGRGVRVEAALYASEGPPDQTVEFDYVNWKGVLHHYVVTVESFEFGPYDRGGGTPRPRDQWQWVMHGEVITRDDDSRPDMGPTRRRTFILSEIKNIEKKGQD